MPSARGAARRFRALVGAVEAQGAAREDGADDGLVLRIATRSVHERPIDLIVSREVPEYVRAE